MKLSNDIRGQADLSGDDVRKLNFVNDSDCYIFRKYYRSGLRSHIFEVLDVPDVQKESMGQVIDGIRMFPRARPKKIFRILRNRFDSIEAVFHEIKKYHLLLHFLGPDFMAESEEFIVEYTGAGKSQIVLCGLQDYVEGNILDPWRLSGKGCLQDLFRFTSDQSAPLKALAWKAQQNIAKFVKKVRYMITDTGYIPDLAGVGNLILTPDGDLKLVDINNIVKVRQNHSILIDDKGYPSCDISIEVLSILEHNIFKKNIAADDPLYQFFLSPERKLRVKALEKKFYKSL